eukprot:7977349-Pyramimonas_sp.AAC.1
MVLIFLNGRLVTLLRTTTLGLNSITLKSSARERSLNAARISTDWVDVHTTTRVPQAPTKLLITSRSVYSATAAW